MEVGFKTDKGRRRSNNEDAFFVMKNDSVFIVADGVGGNQSGEIASRTCVNAIAKYVETRPLDAVRDFEAVQDYFADCLQNVNAAVLEMSEKSSENQGMATTAVIAYIRGGYAYIINVGDSRAYLLRGEEFAQITEDHTYVNTLLKAGLISPEEALNHENKNMITKAVGAEDTVEADYFRVPLETGDILLLCTDGLYGEVNEERLIKRLGEGENLSDICENLTRDANENGGSDNITMIILRVTEGDIHE